MTTSPSAPALPASDADHGDRPPTLVIRPTTGWSALGLRDVFAYRELLWFLAWRDVKVRYKQTLFGAGWAVLQPFLTMVVFTLAFGRLARLAPAGVPQPLFYYSATVPWALFAGSLGAASQSMVGNSSLITKVYFPRLIVPIASTLSGLVDFAVAFAIVAVMLVVFGVAPSPRLLVIPALVALAVATALGVGTWLAALNVHFRDIGYTVPFLVQLWLFASPVAYPSTRISSPLLRNLYTLNPMVGVVDGFRWAICDQAPPAPFVWWSIVLAGAAVVGGFYTFRRMEKTFADTV